ncbi:hypothetical protein JCM8097_002181 [Rhodosporidiobolus ruineniae]
MASTTLSLEPLRLFAGDAQDGDLFARPARLHDVSLEDASESFTRADTKKPLSERLMRVWAERGDYSLLTEESIRNPVEEDKDDKEDDDPRPSVEDMRKLQEAMLHNLNIARGELTTALDLLSVLSAPTDPPDIDPNSLPLPQQTLTLVPTAIPPPPSADPLANPLAALPLAASLDVLKSSANAFFRASEELIPLDEAELAAASSSSSSLPHKIRPRTRAPDPWPTILQLHASSPRTLLPLGAMKGASLTGAGETRTARQVGVFFGCQEAEEGFRRAAVARVGELVEKDAGERTGRKLVVEVEREGSVRERAVWEEKEEGAQGVEKVLKARGRAAFAEELFAQLTKEARKDNSLRAQLKLGTQKEGDSVVMEGSGWTLRLRMMTTPPASISESESPTSSILLPVLRLLYLQEYANRRSASPPPPRPLLATLSALLNYLHRFASLKAVLRRLAERVKADGADVELEFVGAAGREGESAVAEVLTAVQGATEVGGRAVLRVGTSHTFHTFHSYPLPSPPSPSPSVLPPPQPTLSLRVPGKAPIPIPSLRHLETFLGEQLDKAVKMGRVGKKEEGRMDETE